jgi:hypothetical protein
LLHTVRGREYPRERDVFAILGSATPRSVVRLIPPDRVAPVDTLRIPQTRAAGARNTWAFTGVAVNELDLCGSKALRERSDDAGNEYSRLEDGARARDRTQLQGPGPLLSLARKSRSRWAVLEYKHRQFDIGRRIADQKRQAFLRAPASQPSGSRRLHARRKRFRDKPVSAILCYDEWDDLHETFVLATRYDRHRYLRAVGSMSRRVATPDQHSIPSCSRMFPDISLYGGQ